MIEDYKPNSHKSKEEQKTNDTERPKLEKIVSGEVKVKKHDVTHKLKDIFVSNEAYNLKSYIVMDVLVPAIKDAIEDIVTNGIRMILRGETAVRKGSSMASKISYRDFFDQKKERKSITETASQSKYSYDTLIFASRGEAESVLDRMYEILEEYKLVRVADLYELSNVSCSHTYNKYGWTHLRNSKVVRTREGYVIELPKASPID